MPTELRQLTSLRFLQLLQNNFSGSLPSALYALMTLENLRLEYNQFTGTISSQLGHLSKLTTLWAALFFFVAVTADCGLSDF